MGMLKASLASIVTACAAALLASPASAAVLFSDNFEPSPAGNDTLGGAPVADVGSYNAGQSNSIVASAASAAGNPTADPTGGSQYLQLKGSTAAARNFALPSPAGGGTGFKLSFLYAPASASTLTFGFGSNLDGEYGEVFGLSGSTRPRVSFRMSLASAGTSLNVDRDTDSNPATANAQDNQPTLLVSRGVFNSVLIEYLYGTDSIDITVNGVKKTVASPFLSSNGGSLGQGGTSDQYAVDGVSQINTVFFGGGTTASQAFVDNLLVESVPEPTTLAALAAVSVVALRRNRTSMA